MKKDLAFAFLLLLSLIAGGTLTFFAYTQPQIKLNPAFEGNALTTTSQLNEKIEKELFDLFREYEGIGGSLKQAIKEAYIFGLDGQGKGIYYHNPSVLGAPPNLKEDDDYNRVISKEGASVYFLPSAFENEYADTYLNSETETENPFSHLKSDVYEDFNRSSVLFDLMKPNLRKEISFIRYASRSGFLFTYPYVSYDKSYDFTEDHWYQSGISGAKDIVFAIDTSGSLNVSHFEAIKNATGQIIDSLSSTDRFSIVAFSDRINKLSPRLLVATEANKELAVKFIENLRLGGLSDLSGGTTEALNIISNFGYRRNERILLTFTDGYPNSGVIGNESLAETINKENGVAQAKLVYFGVNDKVNLPLLTFLENATDGQFQLANSSDLILDLVPQYSSIIGESRTEFVTWSAPKIDAKMRRIEVNLSMSVVVQDKVVGIL
ncbi:MAG: VWA domain-containing protein, partial [Methanobacteriota archaeon]